MAEIALDKMMTEFAYEGEETTFKTTWFGHDISAGTPYTGTVEYEDPDGFVAAFYSDPTNSALEIIDVPQP